MARKKAVPRKKVARGKKTSASRKPARKKPRGQPKKSAPAAKKRMSARAGKKSTAEKKSVRRRKVGLPRRYRETADFDVARPSPARGLGQDAAGQSGDTEGLSRRAQAASESVEELLEEGQSFEAGVISGVENAADADVSEVITREVPEDDVPQEYLDQD